MKLSFDLDNASVLEFGVGLDDGNGQTYSIVPVDAGVKAALLKMVRDTWDAMQKQDDGPVRYEPSEKYESIEYLFFPLADELAKELRNLHEAVDLTIDGAVLTHSTAVFCYFARLVDRKNHRLTSMRRATQFKGILKSRGRIVRLLDDTLRIVEDDVFKLDSDFDLLIDEAHVHILRPSGFEFAGQMQQAVLDAVSKNIASIKKDLAFVDFDSIEEYAATRPRAARLLASIRGQSQTRNIDKGALKGLCKRTGVEVNEVGGKLKVIGGHEIAFLEVLDRRRYELELVKGKPERFKAASRKKING